MAPPLGGCRDGSGPIGQPPGGQFLTHVPHPLSGKFLHPWFDSLWPGPKMAPPPGGCRDGSGPIFPSPGGQ